MYRKTIINISYLTNTSLEINLNNSVVYYYGYLTGFSLNVTLLNARITRENASFFLSAKVIFSVLEKWKKRFSTLTKAAQELGGKREFRQLRDKMTHWLWSGDRNRIQVTNSLRKTKRVESCVRWKGLRDLLLSNYRLWLRTVIFLILLYNF